MVHTRLARPVTQSVDDQPHLRAFSLAPPIARRLQGSAATRLFITRCANRGLYLDPPTVRWCLCVDEKSKSKPSMLPAAAAHAPGQIERRTHDYKRHGTTSLFAALDTRSGRSSARPSNVHRSGEFRNFLDTRKECTEELECHLILDQLCTHRLRRFQLAGQAVPAPISTSPDSASWLNWSNAVCRH